MLCYCLTSHIQHTTVKTARIGSAKLGPQCSKQINLEAVPPGEYRSGYESPVLPLRQIDCVWLVRD